MKYELITGNLEEAFNVLKDEPSKDKMENVKKETDILLKRGETAKKLATQRLKISNKEYYDMLNSFVNLSEWSFKDSFNVLSIVHSVDITGCLSFATTMVKDMSICDNECRTVVDALDAKCFTELTVLTTTKFNASKDLKGFYTPNDIRVLLSQKKILIIDESFYTTSFGVIPYERYEEYTKFIRTPFTLKDLLEGDTKYSKATLKYIRDKVSRQDIKKLWSKEKDYISNMYSYVTSGTPISKEVSKEFKKIGYDKRFSNLKNN